MLGVFMTEHRNINRGYMKLVVWQDFFVVRESNAAYLSDGSPSE